MENERWIKVKDFPDYEISSFGRIRSLLGPGHLKRRSEAKILTPAIDSGGYFHLRLRNNVTGKKSHARLHRLVAQHFLEGNHSLIVAHLDGNPRNNAVTNLAWTTHKVNSSHTLMHGRRPAGDNHPSAKLCRRAKMAIKRLSIDGYSDCDLAKIFEISESSFRRHKKALVGA